MADNEPGVTFEQAFANAERSALVAAKAGKAIETAAKALGRAAKEGNLVRIRKAAEDLKEVTDAARQDVANARAAWTFTDEAAKDYLRSSYEQELLHEAQQQGLTIHVRDDRLLAFPSIVRLTPDQLAVRVDRKRVMSLRPSHLVRALIQNQKRGASPSGRFLAALYEAYKILRGAERPGATVQLAEVYKMFTLGPGSGTDYSTTDFARDLFALEQSNLFTTSSGARCSLPASTGTRQSGSGVFTFVAPDGSLRRYYSLKFTEEGR